MNKITLVTIIIFANLAFLGSSSFAGTTSKTPLYKQTAQIFRYQLPLYKAKNNWVDIRTMPAPIKPFIKVSKNIILMQTSPGVQDGWISVFVNGSPKYFTVVGFVKVKDVVEMPMPTDPYKLFQIKITNYNFVIETAAGVKPFRELDKQSSNPLLATIQLNSIFIQSSKPESMRDYLLHCYELWLASNPKNATGLKVMFTAWDNSKFGFVKDGVVKIYPKVNLGRGEVTYPGTGRG